MPASGGDLHIQDAQHQQGGKAHKDNDQKKGFSGVAVKIHSTPSLPDPFGKPVAAPDTADLHQSLFAGDPQGGAAGGTGKKTMGLSLRKTDPLKRSPFFHLG